MKVPRDLALVAVQPEGGQPLTDPYSLEFKIARGTMFEKSLSRRDMVTSVSWLHVSSTLPCCTVAKVFTRSTLQAVVKRVGQ